VLGLKSLHGRLGVWTAQRRRLTRLLRDVGDGVGCPRRRCGFSHSVGRGATCEAALGLCRI